MAIINKRDKKGCFLKGHTPWHTGKTKKELPQLSNTGVKKGCIPWNKGKSKDKYPQLSQEDRRSRKLEKLEIMYRMNRKDLIWYWYYDQMKSRSQMAKILNISQAYIQRLFKLYNLQMRTRSESLKGKIPWSEGLTKETDERLKQMSIKMKKLVAGDKNPFYGKRHTINSRKKISQNRKAPRGPNHHFWKGGISFIPYTPEFNKQLKELIRLRDGYRCQKCGCPEIENVRKLSIHHINGNKVDCKPSNLICLCHSCHGIIECQPNKWQKLLARKIIKTVNSQIQLSFHK